MLLLEDMGSAISGARSKSGPGDMGLRMLENYILGYMTNIVTDATGEMPDFQYLLKS